MPITQSNNWENHFRDNPENEVSNRTSDALMRNFHQDVSVDDYLANGIEEQDTVLIMKALYSSHVTFIYHISKLSGMRMA